MSKVTRANTKYVVWYTTREQAAKDLNEDIAAYEYKGIPEFVPDDARLTEDFMEAYASTITSTISQGLVGEAAAAYSEEFRVEFLEELQDL